MKIRRAHIVAGLAVIGIVGGAAFAATEGSADPDVFRANKIAVLQQEERDAATRAAGPRLSESQKADPDPAARLNVQPRTGLVYWRADCPPGPCERQVPPSPDEGKAVSTNNYYLGFDGQTAWSLYAGWTLPSGQGFLRLDRADGRHQLPFTLDQGVPTLTTVTPAQANFVTSAGHQGFLDLTTLKVTFTN